MFEPYSPIVKSSMTVPAAVILRNVDDDLSEIISFSPFYPYIRLAKAQ